MRIGLGYRISADTKQFKKSMAALNTSIADLNTTLTSFMNGMASASKRSTSAVKNTSGAVKDANVAVVRLANDGETAWTKLNKLFAVLDPSHLEGPLGKVQGIIGRLGESRGQFTSSITQEAIQFDKSFASMAANAGVYGKELRAIEGKVMGVAKSLNMDANQLGANFLALKKVGLTPEDLGLNGLADLGRVLEVTGLSGEQLGSIFTKLTRTYGFTDVTAKKFLDSFTQQVTSLGIGTEAFGGLENMLSTLDEKFAVTLAKEGPEAVEKMIKSSVALGAAMTKAIGGTQQENLNSAIELFKTLQDEANVLPTMMAGLSAEFGNLTTEIGTDLPGGFQEAMDAIKEGAENPAAFAANMATLYAELKSGGSKNDTLLTRLSATISQTLGPSFVKLFESGELAVDAITAMSKPTEGGIKSLEALGKAGYRTGRTMDDALTMIKEKFEHTFKSIAYDDAKVFIESQRKAYKEVGQSLKALAEGKGFPSLNEKMEQLGASSDNITKVNDTFSKLARSASLMESGGLAAALTPFIGETGNLGMAVSAVGAATQVLGPLSEFTHALGFDLTDLLTPFTAFGKVLAMGGKFGILTPLVALAGGPVTLGIMAVVAGLAAIVGGIFLFQKAMDGTLGPTIQNFSTIVYNGLMSGMTDLWWKMIDLKYYLGSFDPNAIAAQITSFLTSAIDKIPGLLAGVDFKGGDSPMMDKLMMMFGTGLDIGMKLYEIVTKVMDTVPWGVLFQRALDVAVPAFKAFSARFRAYIGEVLADPKTWAFIGGVAKFVITFLVDQMISNFKMMAGLGVAIISILWEAQKFIVESLFDMTVDVVGFFVGLLFGKEDEAAFRLMMSDVKLLFTDLFDSIGVAFTDLGHFAEEGWKSFMLFGEEALTWLTGLVADMDFQWISDAFDSVVLFLKEGWASFMLFGEEVLTWFTGLFDGIDFQWVSDQFDALVIWLEEGWTAFKEFGTTVLTYLTDIKVMWPLMMAAAQTAIDSVKQYMSDFGDSIGKVFADVFSEDGLPYQLFTLFITNAKASFQLLIDAVVSLPRLAYDGLSWLAEGVGGLLGGAVTTLKEGMGGLATVLETTFNSIVLMFSTAFGKIKGSIGSAVDVFKAFGKVLGFGDESTTPLTEAQTEAAKKTAQQSYYDSLAKGDIQSLMTVLRNEGIETRQVLREIRDRLSITGPSPAAPRASPPMVPSGASVAK